MRHEEREELLESRGVWVSGGWFAGGAALAASLLGEYVVPEARGVAVMLLAYGLFWAGVSAVVAHQKTTTLRRLERRRRPASSFAERAREVEF